MSVNAYPKLVANPNLASAQRASATRLATRLARSRLCLSFRVAENTREQCRHPARSRAGTPGVDQARAQARTRPQSGTAVHRPGVCTRQKRAQACRARPGAPGQAPPGWARQPAPCRRPPPASARPPPRRACAHAPAHQAWHSQYRRGECAGSLLMCECDVSGCSAALGSAPPWSLAVRHHGPDCTVRVRGSGRIQLTQHAPSIQLAELRARPCTTYNANADADPEHS